MARADRRPIIAMQLDREGSNVPEVEGAPLSCSSKYSVICGRNPYAIFTALGTVVVADLGTRGKWGRLLSPLTVNWELEVKSGWGL